MSNSAASRCAGMASLARAHKRDQSAEAATARAGTDETEASLAEEILCAAARERDGVELLLAVCATPSSSENSASSRRRCLGSTEAAAGASPLRELTAASTSCNRLQEAPADDDDDEEGDDIQGSAR